MQYKIEILFTVDQAINAIERFKLLNSHNEMFEFFETV